MSADNLQCDILKDVAIVAPLDLMADHRGGLEPEAVCLYQMRQDSGWWPVVTVDAWVNMGSSTPGFVPVFRVAILRAAGALPEVAAANSRVPLGERNLTVLREVAVFAPLALLADYPEGQRPEAIGVFQLRADGGWWPLAMAHVLDNFHCPRFSGFLPVFKVCILGHVGVPGAA